MEVTFPNSEEGKYLRSWGTQRAFGGLWWSAPAGSLVFLQQQVRNKYKQKQKNITEPNIELLFQYGRDLVIPWMH